MAEIECPNCNEHLVFPQGEPDVFECPECVADLNWDGKHIIGVKTNRKYLFASGENFTSSFNPELFSDAIDFANEVIDNDKRVLSELGGSRSNTVTEEAIIGQMDFDSNFRGFSMAFFLISLVCGVMLLMTAQDLAICLCMVPSLLALAIGWGVDNDHTAENLQLAQHVGGSYREGSGSGFVPESSVYTRYKWKNDTFTFFAFKSIDENHSLELSSFYDGGGESGSERQGYSCTLQYKNCFWIGIESIRTPAHYFERKDLLEDFEYILEIKNQLKKKIGVCLPIRIEFGSSQRRPKNIRKILQSDPELSELWKKLEEGEDDF